MGRPLTYKRYEEQSFATVQVAIELYNKPLFTYKEDVTCVLIWRAYHLLFYAKIIKDTGNKEAIYKRYEKKKTTLSIEEIKEKYYNGWGIDGNVRANIGVLAMLRNKVTHDYVNETLREEISGVLQGAVVNYREFREEWFGKSDSILTPLFYNPLKKGDMKNAFKYKKDRELFEMIRGLSANADPKSKYVVTQGIKFEFVPSDKGKSTPIRHAKEGEKAFPARISDDKLWEKYKYAYYELLQKLEKECPKAKFPGVKLNESFHKMMTEKIKSNSEYAVQRRAYKHSKPKDPYFYSEEALQYLIKWAHGTQRKEP